MKFLLVPLLIIGMFFSFTAALVAMLFFTKTVETPQQMMALVLGGKDSTEIFDEFRLKEDRLSDLFALADTYKTRYEAQFLQSEAMAESLAVERNRLQFLQDSLTTEQHRLDGLSIRPRRRSGRRAWTNCLSSTPRSNRK